MEVAQLVSQDPELLMALCVPIPGLLLQRSEIARSGCCLGGLVERRNIFLVDQKLSHLWVVHAMKKGLEMLSGGTRRVLVTAQVSVSEKKLSP